MRAYYNEHDWHAAAWLRELIREGLIADGDVDERDIQKVKADELRGYTQCHFFAGIGGWSLALRMAGWGDDRPVWTGSCPCQPFSRASDKAKRKGRRDARHLWPVWFDLIEECRPPELFGEQIKDAIADGWLDELYMGLERAGYAVGSAVLPAYAVKAAHQRNRLFWVAHTCSTRPTGYQQAERVRGSASPEISVYGDPIADAGRALASDYSDLLPCDGISVPMERNAITGYGNAIVPQVAAAFIKAYCESRWGSLSPILSQMPRVAGNAGE